MQAAYRDINLSLTLLKREELVVLQIAINPTEATAEVVEEALPLHLTILSTWVYLQLKRKGALLLRTILCFLNE